MPLLTGRGRLSGRRRIWLAVGALASMFALQLVVAGHALAGTCTFDPNTHVASVVGGNVTVGRNASGDLTVDGVPCGTLTTVGKVVIDVATSPSQVWFQLQSGPLGPGFGDEAGGSDEIEFEVTNAQNISQVKVFGTDADDVLTVGARLLQPDFVFVHTLNLNGGQDAGNPGPDEDVIFHGTPRLIELIGSGGNDQLRANGTGAFFSRVASVDVFFCHGLGADTMVGGNGDDTMEICVLTADPGDSFTGGPGFDTVDMRWNANISITLNGIADDGAECPHAGCEGDNIAPDVERIRTGQGNDHLVGGPGPQVFDAGPGANVLEGGPGNDFMTAGTGPDQFHGGTGVDSLSYAAHPAAGGVLVALDLAGGNGAPGENDFLVEFERLFGSAGDDELTGNELPNHLFGGAGDDLLMGQGGDDLLDGGGVVHPDPDIPSAGSVSDGSDDFHGGAGVDTVTEAGHLGAMSLTIDGLANDVVLGDPSQGIDNIRIDVENVIGGTGDDHITGSGQRNTLTGGQGGDTLIGSGDNDVLIPNSGVDDLFGGPGADTASYATSGFPVTVHLGQGTATGQGTDELSDIERATGSAFDDHLTGSAAANTLVGGMGDDVLHGLAGDDGLYGQAGDDTLDGGPGSDLCNHGSGFGSLNSCER